MSVSVHVSVTSGISWCGKKQSAGAEAHHLHSFMYNINVW